MKTLQSCAVNVVWIQLYFAILLIKGGHTYGIA